METREAQVMCVEHGNYTQFDIKKDSEWVLGSCPECDKQRSMEQHEKENLEACAKYKSSLLVGVGVPKRFIGKTFDNYIADSAKKSNALTICRKYAENFESILENGACLVLCGKPGTGKTHLACSIANRLSAKYKPCFTGVYKAISKVKSTFSGGGVSESEVYDNFVSFDLLILDEIGVQFGTDTEKLIMFEILNRRYESMKPTIIISNLQVDELVEYVSERVMDRIKEGGGPVIAFDWESYRK